MESAEDIRQIAHQVINQLPAGASWDDVLYRLVERREIDLGLADSAAGRTTAVESVMETFDIKP
jgi:predicted transcriptional regulator